MHVLQRTVESLQYEKELSKGSDDKVRKLAFLERDVQASARIMLDELRSCRDVVKAEHSAFQSGTELAARKEREIRKLEDQIIQVLHAHVLFVASTSCACVFVCPCSFCVRVIEWTTQQC
jgi:hypothetical protein